MDVYTLEPWSEMLHSKSRGFQPFEGTVGIIQGLNNCTNFLSMAHFECVFQAQNVSKSSAAGNSRRMRSRV